MARAVGGRIGFATSVARVPGKGQARREVPAPTPVVGCSDNFTNLSGWTNSDEPDSVPVIVGGALTAAESMVYGGGYEYCSLRRECDIGSSDYYVEVTVASVNGLDDRIILLMRMNPSSGPNAGFPGWYPINAVEFASFGAPGAVDLNRYTAGSQAGPIGGGSGSFPAPLTVGDLLRAEVQGGTFRGFVNGVQYMAGFDATNPTGQYAGVSLFTGAAGQPAPSIDDFVADVL